MEFSRRLTPPTYQVASKFIADQSSATDTVLVENGWLDLTAVDSRVRRVPSLMDVLRGGRYQVMSNDWIVVPEPDFYRVDVSRLFLAREVLADFGFGGNQGGDFRIYASPQPVLVQVPLHIQLGTEASVPYLGLEWNGDDDGDGGGLEIPEHGASLFLPPVVQDEFRILLRLTGTGALTDDVLVDVPLALALDGVAIPLEYVSEPKMGVWLTSTPVSGKSAGSRVTELRITRASKASGLRLHTVAIR